MKHLITFIATLVLFAGSAFAHSGHGVTNPEQPAHYLVEAAHALPVLLLGAVVYLIVRKHRSAAK